MSAKQRLGHASLTRRNVGSSPTPRNRLLVSLWSPPAQERPTLGVVTFNRKQADLVEEAIQRHARTDADFLQVYERERERTEGGEDMGFFVKNVENVQGDERDVIVFRELTA